MGAHETFLLLRSPADLADSSWSNAAVWPHTQTWPKVAGVRPIRVKELETLPKELTIELDTLFEVLDALGVKLGVTMRTSRRTKHD